MENDFQVYHDLMGRKVHDVLLVASPYDAYIMEEDGSLAARIIDEYQGLNLSRPPRLHQVGCASEALALLQQKMFDLVITMPHISDMDVWSLARRIKQLHPHLPVVLLAHALRSVTINPERLCPESIDHFYIWLSDPALLLAIIKNVEDHLNVAEDTRNARVRVLLLIEDSPFFLSTILPLLYNEVVQQIQAVLTDSLNAEHRLLKMRARPKILAARSYEEAQVLIERYQESLLGVISDVRFPRNNSLDGRAGIDLLGEIRSRQPDLPLLLMSSEPANRQQAAAMPAAFLDKNGTDTVSAIHSFFLHSLGFGEFVFRLPDGTMVGRADGLRAFEEKVATIPEESLLYHAARNHFSNWIMARSEVDLARRLQKMRVCDFTSPRELRDTLVDSIHRLRALRQKGIVSRFSIHDYDPGIIDFVKIGKGSLGGKGRGLAFIAAQLAQAELSGMPRDGCPLRFPHTLVIAADCHEEFLRENDLGALDEEEPDKAIAERFLAGRMPSWIADQLKVFLERTRCPLSVRSSSLLEDAQFRPYAGLYSTYMLANDHPGFDVRFNQLIAAVKLVYASSRFAGPRAFSRRAGRSRPDSDSMAVIVQQLVGGAWDGYFYPVLSGVAQSRNYYPVGPMRSDEGVAHIALGMGKTVVEGEKCLRFAPKYPAILPQFSTVEDMLANAQRSFYALKLGEAARELGYSTSANLQKREVNEARTELPVQLMARSYNADDHRIRDGVTDGPVLITFSRLLRHALFPLPATISALLELGRRGMGCPVEVEFAVELNRQNPEASSVFVLQLRPMASETQSEGPSIDRNEERRAFCSTAQALGHGALGGIHDLVWVSRESFDPSRTREMAREIGHFNRILQRQGSPYLLFGPGRWGSADPWLGIPVLWEEIAGVGAIIELRDGRIRAEPSQGSHFFHNITSMGIFYLTVSDGEGRLREKWIDSLPQVGSLRFVRHLRAPYPLAVKVNAHTGRAVIGPL